MKNFRTVSRAKRKRRAAMQGKKSSNPLGLKRRADGTPYRDHGYN